MTVREAYEERRIVITGAPDSLAARRARIFSLVIDGVPFGDQHVDDDRYAEKDMLANVLVSCGAERELCDISLLAPQTGTNTPDFRARDALSGRELRIEVTEFADPVVKAYLGNLHALLRPMHARVRADNVLCQRLNGIRVVLYFPEQHPRAIERDTVRAEILELMHGIDPRSASFTRRYDPPVGCPHLRSLDVTFTLNDIFPSEVEVRFKPSLTIADADGVVGVTTRILSDKKRKYASYSCDGTNPVWLAAFAADGISGVGLTAIQTLSEEPPDPAPFDRLMVANSVAGLVVPGDINQPAIYQSLTLHRELVRG